MKIHSRAIPAWDVFDPSAVRFRKVQHPIPGWTVLIFICVSISIVIWLAAILLTNIVSFVIVAPRAQTGFEFFLAIGLLLGALTLSLVPDHQAGPRLQWLSMGLLVFALGALSFGFLYPIMDRHLRPGTELYGYLLLRTFGTALIAIGMFPSRPPRLRPGAPVLIMTGAAGLAAAVMAFASNLPVLVHRVAPGKLVSASTSTMPGITPWHWICELALLALGVVATAGAIRHIRHQALGQWIVVGLIAMTGAQLHSMFWPPLPSPMLTTSSALRLVLTLTILAGGILELYHLLRDRSALLTAEQERSRCLAELSVLKDDFTAMVAHELASPLGAISALADLATAEEISPEIRKQTTNALHDEIRLLNTLVADVRSAVTREGQEFKCHIQPVPLATLLDRAVAFANTIDAHSHPLTVDAPPNITVTADSDRIGQVLRNLVGNAIKYTEGGTPVVLRATRQEDQNIRIDVIDWGPGIDPDDQALIFGKYQRGVSQKPDPKSGHGLGLYLSRNIVRMHRSELTLESAPGHGSCFSFQLRESI